MWMVPGMSDRTGTRLYASRFRLWRYADFAVLEENTLAVLPDQVSMATAAVAACAVGSCVQALDGAANLRPEDTVLITGAGGGLGIHALQVAAAKGARVVALTSSSSKIESLRKYGAHDVVLSTDDPVTHLADLTRGHGVDVVLDNVGLPAVFDTGFRALARRGRYVFTGQLEREKISLYPAFVFFKEPSSQVRPRPRRNRFSKRSISSHQDRSPVSPPSTPSIRSSMLIGRSRVRRCWAARFWCREPPIDLAVR